jgi:hypothetical protein
VAEVREEYTRLHQAYKIGEHPPYTQDFQFGLAVQDMRDSDQPTISTS